MVMQRSVLFAVLLYAHALQLSQEPASPISTPAPLACPVSSQNAGLLETLLAAESSPSSATTQSRLDRLFIVNGSEIDTLLEKYKKPIVVKGISRINKVTLTKESLNHVFGLRVKQKSDLPNDVDFIGFHHDYNSELEDQIKPFYSHGGSMAPGVREIFFAYTRNQYPSFKTFFRSSLTREEVIEKLIESLHNIQGYEDQGKNILIRGKASIETRSRRDNSITRVDTFIIDTIVDKETHEIITFFPEAYSSKKEIQQKQRELNLWFERCYFKRDDKTARKTIIQEKN